MSLWQKHGPPTLQNMVGGILATAVVAAAVGVFGWVKPAREWLQKTAVPAWIFLLALVAVCSACWFILRKLKRQLRDAKLLAELERIGKKTEEIATKGLSPLEKAIERGELDETSTKMLIMIANANQPITKEQVISELNLQKAKGDYHFDQLFERDLVHVIQKQADGLLFYEATSRGRQHLAKRNLL